MEIGSRRKVALITGASRGIGRGIAFAMAARNYDLVLTHLNEAEEAEQVAQQAAGQFGTRFVILQGDLSVEETVRGAAEDAWNAFGAVDVLVNNAGLSLFGRITDMPLERINYLMNLNFKAPLLLMQEMSKRMIASGIQGNIINITSSRAERAYPLDAVYGGLKAALKRATESAALELAPHRIRVNCVAPGAIEVRAGLKEHYEKLGDKIPLGRMGAADDIGSAVAWLVSEQASYITGTTIRVDGGLILPGMPEDTSPEAGYGWGKV